MIILETCKLVNTREWEVRMYKQESTYDKTLTALTRQLIEGCCSSEEGPSTKLICTDQGDLPM